MSQKNMGRLAQDMKREVIAIIGRLKDPRLEGGLLTVTRLDVTPDLDVAKVYVSVMGRADGPKPAIEALNRAAGHVRTEVPPSRERREIRECRFPRIVISSESEKSFSFAIDQDMGGQRITGSTVLHATWDHGASCRQLYEGKRKREAKKIPRL